MSAFPEVKRDVVRIDQSPMNPLRWCVELACGHEAWVTAKSRPKRRAFGCRVCGDEKVRKVGPWSSSQEQSGT